MLQTSGDPILKCSLSGVIYREVLCAMRYKPIAYKQEFGKVKERHRKVLKRLLPDLSWKAGNPAGYSIDNTGNIRNNDFKSLY